MSQSDYIGIVDIPDTKNIVAKFVYNFYEPGEKEEKSNTNTINPNNGNATELKSIPMYVSLSFDPVLGVGNLDLSSSEITTKILIFGNKRNTEDSLTSNTQVVHKVYDQEILARLGSKFEVLTDLLGQEDKSNNSAIDQANSITKLDENINKEILLSVANSISENLAVKTKVNEITANSSGKIITQAMNLNLNAAMDTTLFQKVAQGDFLSFDFKKVLNINDAVSIEPVTDEDSSFSPSWKVRYTPTQNIESGTFESNTGGYIISRKTFNLLGKLEDEKEFVIYGKTNTNLLDTSISYGKKYVYAVKTLIFLGIGGGSNDSYTLIVSRPSRRVEIETIETTPPAEPDGVFYRYIYENSGLDIRWQYPVGTQKDTKKFQIFKRKTLNDPFTAIAEIDFTDDDTTNTEKEVINENRVHKTSAPLTRFVDLEFSKTTSYIYAIASVDAHGLTSGYSNQVQVKFDNTRNTIILVQVSKSGAPKQYPNFFIRPSLGENIFVDSFTQDAMLSSHKKKIKIYFDPDAIWASFTDANVDKEFSIVKTSNNSAKYNLLLFNIDRHKSKTVKIEVENKIESTN